MFFEDVLPEAHSKHRLKQFFDVWLDAGTHGSRKHANTRKHCSIHLHGLLPPAQMKDQ